ncbi:MAG: G1 family glutamic endopeptidase [Candidatus Lutacidiplasmatales archaeon]
MNAGVRTASTGFVLVLTVLAFGIPVAAVAPLVHGSLHHGTTKSTSTNWAGYAVTSSKGSVTDVKGSWIVPAIQGKCPSSGYQYSSFWVGIDGYASKTVEQTGTDSDCQGGSATYYGWYEFYPKASFLFSITISAGDTIFAEVKFANAKFTVTLKDVTTGKSASTSSKVTAARNSAEWIAEAPASSGGVLPLADFGTAHFGYGATGVASTCDATISGTTAAIGSLTNIHSITMVNNAGTANKATTSSLSSSGSSFNVTWASAGP